MGDVVKSIEFPKFSFSLNYPGTLPGCGFVTDQGENGGLLDPQEMRRLRDWLTEALNGMDQL